MNDEEMKVIFEELNKKRKGYQPLYGFPESKRGAEYFDARTNCVLDYCGKDKSYLVLGSNLGYTAFGIVRAGGKAKGVEGNKGLVDYCNDKLKVYYKCDKSNPIFIHSEIFKWFETNEEKFDCVISFMVLHNLLKSHTMQQILELVNNMADKTDCLIVQSRHKQWCRDGFNISFPDVPKFIVEHTKFTSYEIITDGKNPKIAIGLPLWAFKKEAKKIEPVRKEIKKTGLLKYKHPVVFLAAQGKCGKGYMAGMVKHSLVERMPDGKVKEMGKAAHEWLVRGMEGVTLIGWFDPIEKVKSVYPGCVKVSLEEAMNKAENVWNRRSLPILEEHTKDGPFIDAESRFIVIYYYLVKKYIHPDSMRIIIMRRPLESIAWHNCRHGAMKIVPGRNGNRIHTGNLVHPWGNNNVTITPYEIGKATQQELNVWYTFEMEERKKKVRDYFPDVDIMEWDMEKDSPSFERWYELLDFLSVPHRKLTMKPRLENLISVNKLVHPGPIRCHKHCPDIEPCTEEFFRKKVQEHKVIMNPNKRPDFMF